MARIQIITKNKDTITVDIALEELQKLITLLERTLAQEADQPGSHHGLPDTGVGSRDENASIFDSDRLHGFSCLKIWPSKSTGCCILRRLIWEGIAPL